MLSHTDHTVAVPSRTGTVALGSNGQPSKSQRLVSYRDVIWARKMPLVTSVHDMPLVEPGQIAPTSVVSGHVVGSRARVGPRGVYKHCFAPPGPFMCFERPLAPVRFGLQQRGPIWTPSVTVNELCMKSGRSRA